MMASDEYLKPSTDYNSALCGTYKPYSKTEGTDFMANVAALKQLGKYFDFLRQNDVYDNTRIIVVSDHGFGRHFTDFNDFPSPEENSRFNCLFMVKDFNSNEDLKTDETFMTNADTLFEAK